MKYYRPLLVILLIIVVSMVVMNNTGDLTDEKVTGYAVSERPIQEVTKDLEEGGFERVANDPTLSYTE